jgi:glycosyltransferase involved in cell wall biosynthesis
MKARIIQPQRKRDCVLSIGMIVKNEEKWLERCLSALKPLRDAVETELVIVDTGSVDRTVKIAEKFTDKIHHFEWVDDFAAARNFGLKKCIGEWFMFIDADEIFDNNMSEMIEFFNSGKSKDFNTACYIIRNYSQGEGGYTTQSAQRIARRTPQLCFEGEVHERLVNKFLPTQQLMTFAHHYGYVYESDEQHRAKKDRNLELLYKMLQKNPEDTKVLCDIAACLMPDKKAQEYIVRAVELVKKSGDYSRGAHVEPYMAAIRYFSNGEYEKTVKYADEYIKIAGNEANLIDAYAFKVIALSSLEEYSQMAAAADKYYECYDRFYAGQLDNRSLLVSPVNWLGEDKRGQLGQIVDLTLQIARAAGKIFQ